MNPFLLAVVMILAAQAPQAGPDGWSDWGAFMFDDLEHMVQHSVNEDRHRFTLQRIVERTGPRATRWEILDVVETRFVEGEFVCMGPARSSDGKSEYLVVGREDKTHTHPVTQAWRFNRENSRLDPVPPTNLSCSVDECLDDEEQ